MANSLDITADSRKLRFNDDFTVQELDAGGNPGRQTKWESVSTEKENEISFRFNDETKTSLAVKYTFNDRNQLTLQVVKQPGVAKASAVWTLPGKIFVDDIYDVEYILIDEAGKLTQQKISVYSTLSFTDEHNKLRITFVDKTETFVMGVSEYPENLSTEEYAAGGDLARDLLAFQAVTTNTIGGKEKDINAEIKFYGRWDLHENSLVFVTRYDNTGTTPVGYVALAGEIKGTNFGLILETNGNAALQISGRYAWNKNSLGWDLAVGHSKAAGLEARLGVDAKFEGAGKKLTLKGGATLKKGKQGIDLTFDLKLTYSAKNRNIVFSLEGSNGSYEIKLSGDFKIKMARVKFEITASDKNGKKSVKGTVEFGYYNKNTELKLALEATLTKNGIQLVLNMEFRFFWGPNGPVAELP